MAGLAALCAAASTQATAATAADAAQREGSDVTVTGTVSDAHAPTAAAPASFVVRDASGAVRVTAARLPDAMLVRVTGLVVREAGQVVVRAQSVVGLGAADAAPAWGDLAKDPRPWEGVPVRLAGAVHGSTFGDAGHELRVGKGAWPKSGVVEAHGMVAYDEACMCERFDADRVTVRSSGH